MEHIKFSLLYLSWRRIVQKVLRIMRKVGYFCIVLELAADGHKLQNAVNCGICLQKLLLGRLESVCASWRLSHSNYIVYCSANQRCLSVCLTASHPVSLQIKSWSFSCTSSRHEYYYRINGPSVSTSFRFVYSII